jgi:hypothetical protein
MPPIPEVMSVAMTYAAEPLAILQLQGFTVIGPEKPILTMCLKNCSDDDTSRAMPMVSPGLSPTTKVSCVFTYSTFSATDDTEDVDECILFEEVLQGDWKPWPPNL